jgi:hypothetical protein
MIPITIFSWGYWGWGNATDKLIQAFDAVEQSRGFEPPIFVDVRLSRSVRAPGFNGNLFEKKLGSNRHYWIKALGNEGIRTTNKKSIHIADPLAAYELLYRAMDAAQQNRRVIFFCNCPVPRRCHRWEVARLVLNVARKRDIAVEIVEWPGGKAKHIDLEVTPELFRALTNDRKSIPIGARPELSEAAALPWGTTITIHADGKELHRLIGPATHERGEWSLPVLDYWDDVDVPLADYKREAAKVRKDYGYEPRRSI